MIMKQDVTTTALIVSLENYSSIWPVNTKKKRQWFIITYSDAIQYIQVEF